MILSTQISHSHLRWKLIFNIIHQPHNDSGGTNKTDIYAIMSTYLKLWYATYSFTSHIMAVTWNVSIFTYVLRGYFSRISGQKQSIETWASKLYKGKLLVWILWSSILTAFCSHTLLHAHCLVYKYGHIIHQTGAKFITHILPFRAEGCELLIQSIAFTT